LGTLILYNTGYSADGLKQFIINAGKANKDRKDSTYSHVSYRERSANIDKIINKYGLTTSVKGAVQERFREKTQ
jgi:hypothetical protein